MSLRPRGTLLIAAALVLAGGCGAGGSAAAVRTGGSDVAASTSTTVGSTTRAATACKGTAQTKHADQVYESSDDRHLTSLDVYQVTRPSGCGPAPIVFWVHGGGWRSGDKGNQLADKRAWTLAHGWTLVSVNYRLAPKVTYPVPNQDVAHAVAWTLAHARQFGADPTRTALMGHSAGGGIVAAVTTDERYLADAGSSLGAVDCTVSLDTEGYDVTQKGGDGGIYDAMFGTDPARWPDESPITHVAPGKDIPSYFIVTRGTASRRAGAHRFADALTAAKVPTTIIETPSLDHNGVNAAVGHPGDTLVTPALTSFLSGCFA